MAMGLATSILRSWSRFHRAQGTLATLTAVQPEGRFGAFTLEEHDSEIWSAFHEKPESDGAWINGGFSCSSPR